MIRQFKTHLQETLEFKMNKQIENFSFSPPINLVEEGKWLLGVTSFECTNSVSVIANENNSFSVIIPGRWQTNSGKKTIDELNNSLEPKSQKSTELHVKEVRKRGIKILKRDIEYKISDFDAQKNEIFEELKM